MEMFQLHRIDVLYAQIYYSTSESNDLFVKADLDNHNNVVEFDIIGENSECIFSDALGTQRTQDSVEFWLYKDNITLINVDSMFTINQLGWIEDLNQNLIGFVQLDSWNHLKYTFESNPNEFDLYLNGIKIGDDISHSKNDFSQVVFNISTNFDWDDEDNKYSMGYLYLDAIDFSWSSGYYNGRSFTWDYSLENISKYQAEYINYPFGTNIDTDLSTNIVEMNTITDIAEFNFDLILDGPDNNALVSYDFNLPDGFSITPGSLYQTLQSTVQFNISANDPYQLAGIYYFDMNISYYGDIIYSEQNTFLL